MMLVWTVSSSTFRPVARERKFKIASILRPPMPVAHRRLVDQPSLGVSEAVHKRCRRMATLVVRAIDQEPANARGPHFSESDLLLTLHQLPSRLRLAATLPALFGSVSIEPCSRRVPHEISASTERCSKSVDRHFADRGISVGIFV